MTDPDELEALAQAVWAELADAVHARVAGGASHPWRLPVLATHGPEGPQARTIVLREVLAEQKELIFYTDARSAKVAELEADRRGQLVCWSPALGWQLRLSCEFQVLTDGLDATSRWAAIRHSRSAQDYLSPLAPGQFKPADVPGAVQSSQVGEQERLPRHHFAMVVATVLAIDWLALDPQGHRRARLAPAPMAWLVP